MNQSDCCRRFIVSGHVQGVFFRSSTAQQARRLGLRGSAINLADGRVEVLAAGPRAAVDELAEWLREGPRRAEVTDVQVISEDLAAEIAPGFTTG